MKQLIALSGLALLASACPPIDCSKAKRAKFVREVGPCDFDAIFAIGDSITAAAVPYPFDYGIEEYRGISFSAGGDPGALTVPNILANVSGKKLIGPSVSHHFIEFPNEGRYTDDRGNAAQSGARMQNVIAGSGNQVNYLNDWSRANGWNASMWTFVTVLITANDICRGCDASPYTGDQFSRDFETMLQGLYKSFPKALINVAPIFNISQVYGLGSTSSYCSVEHALITECPCLWHQGDAGRKAMDDITVVYNNVINAAAQRWSAKNLPTFNVVSQPGMTNFVVPELNWLSPIDCFHPSASTHEVLAAGFWSQLTTPIEQKTFPFDYKKPIRCPDVNSIFYN